MLTEREIEELRAHPLSYANIGGLVGNTEAIEHEHYEAYWTPILGLGSFIFLHRTMLNQYQPNPMLSTRSNGYKLHVSVYDPGDDNGNLEQAWDIFVKCVLRHDIYHVKIIAPRCREILRRDDAERGKEITIYAFKEARPTEQWQRFLQELTKEFIAHGIVPGRLPPGDACITGSGYFSYRNDSSDFSLADPFKAISLTDIEQPRRTLIEGDTEERAGIAPTQ